MKLFKTTAVAPQQAESELRQAQKREIALLGQLEGLGGITRKIYGLESTHLIDSIVIDAHNNQQRSPRKGFVDALAAREQRLQALKSERSVLLDELESIRTTICDLRRRVLENTVSATDNGGRIRQLIAEASKTAPSRVSLQAAVDKLADLRSQLAAAENQMANLTSSPTSNSAEERANALLETGTMPLRSDSTVELSRDAWASVQALTRAVKIQESRTERARENFADDVRAGIQSLMLEIARVNVDGIRQARAAVLDARALRAEFERVTGRSEMLPCLTFRGLQEPLTDVKDTFDFHLERLAEAGIEV